MIAHASMNQRLVPGEIFGSGTEGVGSAATVGESLALGGEVTLRINGLGVFTNRIVWPVAGLSRALYGRSWKFTLASTLVALVHLDARPHFQQNEPVAGVAQW